MQPINTGTLLRATPQLQGWIWTALRGTGQIDEIVAAPVPTTSGACRHRLTTVVALKSALAFHLGFVSYCYLPTRRLSCLISRSENIICPSRATHNTGAIAANLILESEQSLLALLVAQYRACIFSLAPLSYGPRMSMDKYAFILQLLSDLNQDGPYCTRTLSLCTSPPS
ncbi:hypothetical protein M413DRAFT_276123 [Hebeloma cylindrosporum]|uniref:Uncharacterized protein n=1 Tax=Hebeloma cylindrosporum TaxID=76867 RepID=A0A0C3C0R4_HEBCY|nr:hypothetical protein M413DRAFT_276123 [Hebeloma cylindrosporum h7]